ncbi:MAG: cupredoxin domain-containing protein [Nanoarchaeota archaeon]|nr:cupredoxin domain-containing protein [Nanoarchaeota archaeon]MBU1632781.1 cupredoxin domain-containing protein [Nanoarchaeota archaeon]MBU1876534.1 cupredoxin domain-containing protein [Nanoarchaeota archaeon]
MEQKQLDEIDESFFGEEFVEDEMISESEPKLKENKEKKSSKNNSTKKSAVKKSEKKMTAKKEEKERNFNEFNKDDADASYYGAIEKEEVEIKHVKESFPVETSPPVDPWDEEDDNNGGLLGESSTWKILTGIAVILLVASVFTQGFRFSENSPVEETKLTLSEAEEKAVVYVNANLLQPPFQAEVESSEELKDLYRITLGVAGQSVNSYITKDGKLFFPQGFEVLDNPSDNVELSEGTSDSTSEDSVSEENVNVEAESEDDVQVDSSEDVIVIEESVTEPIVEEAENVEDAEVADDVTLEESDSTTESETAENAVEEVVTTTPATTIKKTLDAKKWLFTPNEVTVAKGSSVEFTIIPTGLDFTFEVPDFGVKKDVSGTTKVTFTADKAGTFEFKCGSCEDWRGMTGILTVK